MKGFLFLLCLIAGVVSQSYMTEPPARQPAQASEVGPCGVGTYPSSYEIPAGRFLTAKWNLDENDNNGGRVRFSLLSNSEVLIRSLVNVTFATQSASVRIPSDVTPGTYTLQWSWKTYYSCTKLNVLEDPINSTVIQMNTPVDDYLENTLQYYEFERTINIQPMLVTARMLTGNGPASFYAISGLENIPNSTFYRESGSVGGGSTMEMGLCPQGSGWMIGVVGPENVPETDSFTFTVQSYDGLINIGTPAVSVPKHTGNRYFVTQSYKTETERRVVIRASSAFSTSLELGQNCGLDEGRINGQVISPTLSCIQLNTQQGNKYIRVGPMPVEYSIATENGLCVEASAYLIKSSFVLILICWVVIFGLF